MCELFAAQVVGYIAVKHSSFGKCYLCVHVLSAVSTAQPMKHFSSLHWAGNKTQNYKHRRMCDLQWHRTDRALQLWHHYRNLIQQAEQQVGSGDLQHAAAAQQPPIKLQQQQQERQSAGQQELQQQQLPIVSHQEHPSASQQKKEQQQRQQSLHADQQGTPVHSAARTHSAHVEEATSKQPSGQSTPDRPASTDAVRSLSGRKRARQDESDEPTVAVQADCMQVFNRNGRDPQQRRDNNVPEATQYHNPANASSPAVPVNPTDAADDSLLRDTVGCVCADAYGRVAAGVSSGGIAMKLSGRVGEAAMYGCGCWAAPADAKRGRLVGLAWLITVQSISSCSCCPWGVVAMRQRWRGSHVWLRQLGGTCRC